MNGLNSEKGLKERKVNGEWALKNSGVSRETEKHGLF